MSRVHGNCKKRWRCPRCGADVERIHRRLLDRLLAVFHSVHRYRCTDPSCAWQGVIDRRNVECTAWERTSLRVALLASIAAIAVVAAYTF